jgi:DsbC/DsbD-like thiol-disulfide interchange protein
MLRVFVPALLLAATISAGDAWALESSWVEAAQSRVRLLAAGAPSADPAAVTAGVEIHLDRGWKTYWRYPGDAGIPPRFDWAGSDNLMDVEVLWPAPRRLVDDGGTSIGYLDAVVFPLRVHPRDPKRPVRLALKLDFAVCDKICIPADARLSLALSAAGENLAELKAAEARVPRRVRVGEGGSLAVLGVRLERGAVPRALIEVAVPPGRDFDLFAEGPDEAWALPVPQRASVVSGRAHFVVPLGGAPPGADPVPANLRLTLVAGNDAIEVMAPLD